MRYVRKVPLSLLAMTLTMEISQAQNIQPYAGMQSRPIKALSEEQTADLKSARGMGLALAAELNGYPGPSHLLELADKLDLTVDQRSRVQQLFDSMKQEALPLGLKLIEKESDLDRQFSNRLVTPESLKTAIAEIAATQGALRETHLKYHLSTAVILTQNQMQRYAELRGYGVHDPSSMQHRH